MLFMLMIGSIIVIIIIKIMFVIRINISGLSKVSKVDMSVVIFWFCMVDVCFNIWFNLFDVLLFLIICIIIGGK